MRPLAFLLTLLLAQGAWADTSSDHATYDDPWPVATEEDVRVRGYKPGSRPGLPMELSESLPSSYQTDRFLSTVVQPEIEDGDKYLRGYSESVNPQTGVVSRNKQEVDSARAIAHYLKALVLLEEERLRRESR